MRLRAARALRMNSDRLINILAALALVELMLTIGVGARVADVIAVARDWRGVARAFVANYVLVPGVAVGLVLLFRAHPLVAAGVMIVAACPGAPYAPPFTALARGRVDRAVGLMVMLAGSSAVIAPLLLKLLLPLVSGGGQAGVDSGKMLTTLALVQFLPLCVGLGVSAFRPALAQRLNRPLQRLGAVLNLGLFGLILVVQFPMLAAIQARGYAGMFALLAASAAAGWLLAGGDAAERRTLAITTAVRNAGVGLVIAGGSYPGTPAVTFTTAYALLQTVAVAVAAYALGRTAAAPAATTTTPAPGSPPGAIRSASAT